MFVGVSRPVASISQCLQNAISGYFTTPTNSDKSDPDSTRIRCGVNEALDPVFVEEERG